MPTSILLMGARGCGKSTIGRRLAERLGWAFADLDEATLSRFPTDTVQQVFTAYGELAWRSAEAESLAELLRADRDQILALGGGTPFVAEARGIIELQKESGQVQVVYLAADAAVLSARIRENPGDRPSLTGDDPADEMANVLAKREPGYRALADKVIDVGTRSAEDVLGRLEAWVSETDW